MEDVKIIGHRGVRGIETENTINAIQRSVAEGADAVELDIHASRDGRLVFTHNRSLRQVYGVNRKVDELTLAELKKIKSKSGESIPTLQEVLDLKLTAPLMLDIKKSAAAETVCLVMRSQANARQPWFVSTFYWDKALAFKKQCPDILVSLATYKQPLQAISQAQQIGAGAITIPLYLLNPLVYHRAKKAGLKILLYMNYLPFLLASPRIVRGLCRTYPGVIICTDRPDKIVPALNKQPAS